MRILVTKKKQICFDDKGFKVHFSMPTHVFAPFNTRYKGMFFFGDLFFIHLVLLTKANDIIILKHTISVSLGQL